MRATLGVSEANGVGGELRRMTAFIRNANALLLTETLEASQLRMLLGRDSLLIPGRGTLSIPYEPPPFGFDRADAITITVQGEFVDANGNASSPTSAAVPVPIAIIGTCLSSLFHLCLNNSRFQVDVLFNGVRANVLVRENDTDGRFELSALQLLVKVVNTCVVNNSYAVQVTSATVAAFAFSVFVTDTLIGTTKAYTSPSRPFTTINDTTAFATCP